MLKVAFLMASSIKHAAFLQMEKLDIVLLMNYVGSSVVVQ